MKYPIDTVRTRVHIQPVLHLVDFFEESTEYDRHCKLPFNSLSLCVRENPRDPSWIELPEKGCRIRYEAGIAHFTTVETPMRIRYTTANRHFCIHFRYELFPGVDLFSGLHERYILKDKDLAQKIRLVFAEPDPIKRLAGAEAMAHGLPVAAFDTGGMREWLEDGVNGFAVPELDVPALAAKIELLANDRKLAARMGAAGREIVMERFSPGNFLAAVETLLE
ncbi:MAG: glycosyltransferase, partial [Lentisphaeria bacterium]|nr:glycosyltransferase [Lentisphaeria bacterium]